METEKWSDREVERQGSGEIEEWRDREAERQNRRDR